MTWKKYDSPHYPIIVKIHMLLEEDRWGKLIQFILKFTVNEMKGLKPLEN